MADQLEGLGVLGKPEDYGITVQHVSPSFLVKDARSRKTRFVTAFNNNLSAYHQLQVYHTRIPYADYLRSST